MKSRIDMSYSDMIIADRAEERPSYFMCGKKSVNQLKERARKEAEKILNEFKLFYSGDFSIEIIEVDHDLCYSVGAILKVNGNVCRQYDDVELLFIDLNELMMKRLLEARKETKNG